MSVRIFLSRKTRPIRHWLIRIGCPTVYWNCLQPARPMVQFLASQRLKGLVGAEIGVDRGVHALSILETLDVKLLFLVDPYLDRPERKFDAEIRLDCYEEKILFVEKTSSEAARMPLISGLDFLYHDGDHSYVQVKQDLVEWIGKVRCGGVFGGHDYSNFPDVQKAVNEFVKEYDLKLHKRGSDWWIIKS